MSDVNELLQGVVHPFPCMTVNPCNYHTGFNIDNILTEKNRLLPDHYPGHKSILILYQERSSSNLGPPPLANAFGSLFTYSRKALWHGKIQ